ncbi:MAG TPA: hypothetical protein P5092_15690 [Ruminococcus sp.]|nr:hypothetical protein [Ruminococcus sp.]
MSNKMLPTESGEPDLPVVQRTYNLDQSGDGTNIGVAQSLNLITNGEAGIQAENIENVNVSISVAPPLITPQPKVSQQMVAADRTHYNLFVTYGVDWTKPDAANFKIEPDRVPTGYMEDSVKAEFSTLSDEAIARIKRFPSIFANENNAFGHTDEDQILAFGFVKQIKVRRNGVMIYPDIKCYLPQQRLNEALFELDISGTDSFNEFNRMHWSIKKIDLIAELRELGFTL